MIDHDSLYHRLFSHPEMVADLLKDFLEPELLKTVDLTKMRRINTKLTAPKGQRRRGDIVWEIPIEGGGNLFVLLMLEFQSDIEEWMVLRISIYTGLLYQQLVDERKLKITDGLPPVLPIVLFNGEPRWNAPETLQDLIRLPRNSPLWKYQPEMRYYAIDEGKFSEQELKGRKSLNALLFRMESQMSPGNIAETVGELARWFQEHPDGPPVKRLFRELLDSRVKHIKGLEGLLPLPDDLMEVGNMLAERVEQWEQKWKLEGLQQGGAGILLHLLKHKFGNASPEIHEKITNADLSTLEKWSLRCMDAKSLDDVFDS